MEILVPGTGRRYFEGDSLDQQAPIAFTIDGVMSADECKAFIARIEEAGPEDAPVTTSSGPVMMKEVRNNTRVIFDDVSFAAMLYERVRAALPSPLAERVPCGANERLRCYKYDPGQEFKPHYDGYFARDNGEQSFLTFMVYLNEEFTGGETAFHDYVVKAQPKTGRALLFQHATLHEGCKVKTGVKYVVRSDVMYKRA